MGTNKRTIMDLQNLISLNRFLLTATAWEHKRGASLTFIDMIGQEGMLFQKIERNGG